MAFFGELLITAASNRGSASHWTTGISVANLKTALGITATLADKGTAYTIFRAVKSTGALYAQLDAYYGYGMVLLCDSGIYIPARYYTTAGDVGRWAADSPQYDVNTVWQFELVMTS